MRLSTRTRYGMRAMLELASDFENKSPMLMSKIADNMGISRKYLHSIMTVLRVSGLIRSVRGSGGGFMLKKSPEEIYLDEIMKALEGTMSIVDCVDDNEICERGDNCITRKLWTKLGNQMNDTLKQISLKQLASINETNIPGL